MKTAGLVKQDRGNRLNLKERLPPDWDKEEKMWKSGELFTFFADWKVDTLRIMHKKCKSTVFRDLRMNPVSGIKEIFN